MIKGQYEKLKTQMRYNKFNSEDFTKIFIINLVAKR